jgi:ubiquinone/menaquinone biosynthesis C-methylase UbiE
MSRFFTIFFLMLVLTFPVVAQDAPAEREPAAVMSYHGAPWLERETRDEEERPYEVLEKMNLENGDVVVDMGVGTGYFARKIAKRVGPDGKVYGVDIQPEMIELLKKYCAEEGITNVEPVLGAEDDPKLPKGEIDWIILADVYHEFQQPKPMLEKMRESLKPDGRIALLEYRLNGDTARHIKVEHRMSVEQVLAEWQPAGFELVDLHEFLPSQHFFIFKKRDE